MTFMDREHTNNKLNYLLLEFKRGNAHGCGRDLKLIGLFFLDPPTTLSQMDGKCCCTSPFFCLSFFLITHLFFPNCETVSNLGFLGGFSFVKCAFLQIH